MVDHIHETTCEISNKITGQVAMWDSGSATRTNIRQECEGWNKRHRSTVNYSAQRRYVNIIQLCPSV